MASELHEHGFNFRQCYRAFGMTYNQTIKSFGWEITHKWSVKTDKELIIDYIMLHEELGRIPTYIDIDKVEDMASSQTYKKRIGDLQEIRRVCGIEVSNDMIGEINNGCGILFLNKNNEICLSQPELLISNFLIDNEISYIKEYRYSNVIEGEDPRKRFDWYLVGANIFVEYFGLFNINKINDEDIIGRYTRKALDKINKCEMFNVTLISLFPEDVENNLFGVRKKIKEAIQNTHHKTVSVETMRS